MELLGEIVIALLILPMYWSVFKPKSKEKATSVSFETQLPIPIGASTCTHSWEKESDQLVKADGQEYHSVVMVCHKCGAIDKTYTGPCKHQWELVSKDEVPSAYKQSAILDRPDNIPKWFYQSKLVVTMKCSKCGENKVITANNLE